MKTYKIVIHNPKQVDINDNILDDKSNIMEEYKDFKSRSEAKRGTTKRWSLRPCE